MQRDHAGAGHGSLRPEQVAAEHDSVGAGTRTRSAPSWAGRSSKAWTSSTRMPSGSARIRCNARCEGACGRLHHEAAARRDTRGAECVHPRLIGTRSMRRVPEMASAAPTEGSARPPEPRGNDQAAPSATEPERTQDGAPERVSLALGSYLEAEAGDEAGLAREPHGVAASAGRFALQRAYATTWPQASPPTSPHDARLVLRPDGPRTPRPCLPPTRPIRRSPAS